MLNWYNEGVQSKAPAPLQMAGSVAHRKELDMRLQSTTLPSASGIYSLTNAVSGKVYVGSGVNMRRRELEHCRQLLTHTHNNAYLQHAWDKDGAAAFTFAVLALVPDITMLLEQEQVWLDALRSYDPSIGYNLSPTATSILGYRFTDEQRARVAAGIVGRPKSAEHRAAISAARRALIAAGGMTWKWQSDRKGKPQAAEHRAKKAAAQTGEKNHQARLTDAQVEEMRAGFAEGVHDCILAQRFGVSARYVAAIRLGYKRKRAAIKRLTEQGINLEQSE